MCETTLVSEEWVQIKKEPKKTFKAVGASDYMENNVTDDNGTSRVDESFLQQLRDQKKEV